MSRPRQRTPQRGWCQTLFLVLTCCLRNQKQSLTPDGAKNRLSSSSLSLAINAAATQRNVQLCTEVDVRGGQQGSLEINSCQTNWLYDSHNREVTRYGRN